MHRSELINIKKLAVTTNPLSPINYRARGIRFDKDRYSYEQRCRNEKPDESRGEIKYSLGDAVHLLRADYFSMSDEGDSCYHLNLQVLGNNNHPAHREQTRPGLAGDPKTRPRPFAHQNTIHNRQ